MRSIGICSVLTVLAFATGCGTTIHATEINVAPKPMRPRPVATVELFTSGPPQDRPYVDVALLEAEQMSAHSVDDTPQFIVELRERAASMGCDGLVIGAPTNAAPVTLPVVLDAKPRRPLKGLMGTCIVFTPSTHAG